MNEFLIELVYRSLILASLGLCVRFALVRSSAQARAAVLTVTVLALALLPLSMVLLPRLTVTVAKHEFVESAVSNAVASVPSPPGFVFPWILVWTVVTTLLLARVAYSLYRFKRLEQGFAPASDSLAKRVKNLTKRAHEVFFCPEGEPPMTWGFLQPKIALPTESEQWVEPQLRSVVLHEDAHIRRKDWAVMIGFRAAVAAYWFNPLVWLLQKLYELDSERAADDFVLAQGVEAPEYAGRLVEVAKTLRHQKTRIPAVTMARSHRLNGRVASILSTKTQRGMLKGWTRISVLGLLVTGAVATGTIVPEIKQIRLAVQVPKDASPVSPIPSTNLNNESKILNVDFDMGPETDENVPSKNEPNKEVHHLATGKNGQPNNPKQVRPSNKVNKDSIALNSIGDIKIEVPDDIDMNSIQKEISDGLKQAKEEIQKAKKESEKSMRDAEAEIDKSEMPEAARQMAKASIKMAKGVADNLVDSMQIDLNPKPKKTKATPTNPPRSPKTPADKKDQ